MLSFQRLRYDIIIICVAFYYVRHKIKQFSKDSAFCEPTLSGSIIDHYYNGLESVSSAIFIAELF